MRGFDSRAVMVACAATNLAHMPTTPAGRASPGALVKLYQRLAGQGLACAQAWKDGRPCPSHEPAVDAFWWGVAAWARSFSTDLVYLTQSADEPLLREEMQEVFCRPHREFACWLRPLDDRGMAGVFHAYSHVARTSPARLVLAHDAAWTSLVIRLTARWGLRRHLKDLPALWQSLSLVRRLKRWPDPTAVAYLESDLMFLRQLFDHFPFSSRLRAALDQFIDISADTLSAAQREVLR